MEALVLPEIGKRLEKYINYKKLSANKLGEAASSSGTQVRNIIAGENFSVKILNNIVAAEPDLNIKWLLFGEGAMQKTGEEGKEEKEKKNTHKKHRKMSEDLQVIPSETGNITFIPTRAQAGYMAGFADPEFLSTMPRFSLPHLGMDDGPHLAMQVSGDSMLPKFANGDIFFGKPVENGDPIRPGEIYAILLRDGLVIKQVRINKEDHNKLDLVSTNDHYDPYTIHKLDVLAMYRFKAVIGFNSNLGVGFQRFIHDINNRLTEIENKLLH